MCSFEYSIRRGLHGDVLPPSGLNPIPYFVGPKIFKSNFPSGDKPFRGLELGSLQSILEKSYALNQQAAIVKLLVWGLGCSMQHSRCSSGVQYSTTALPRTFATFGFRF